MSQQEYTLSPIGHVKSPYKEKFAVPRQAQLAPSVKGEIHLTGMSNNPQAVRELEQYSHLWLLFLFDQNLEQGWQPTVRPPRLGGNKRVGVFASRSPFRPNGIGMSIVKLHQIEHRAGNVILHISGMDLVDNTPIVDIKPYVPYSDAMPDAAGGFAPDAPQLLEVEFSESVQKQLANVKGGAYQQQAISEILAQDPRPAYKKGKQDDKEYGVKLFDYNVKFRVYADKVLILSL